MSTYTPIITTQGQQLILDSIAFGTEIKLKYFAWGDGNGFNITPSASYTSLVNEVYRQEITYMNVNNQVPTWLEVITEIPSSVGGFYIREVGLFTENNTLFAVASHPEVYKNFPEEGTFYDFREKLILEITDLAQVTISIDPSLITATKQDIENHKHDGTGFNPSKIDLSSEVKGLLPTSNLQDIVILADGSVAMTSNFNLGNKRIVNLNEPINSSDAVNRNYLDNLNAGYNPKGLIVSNNLASPDNIVDISIGRVLSKDKSLMMISNSVVSKNLSSSWIPSNGGGLAVGLTKDPDTFYHVFIISKLDGTIDFGFDTSIDAINLLATATGYTKYRRIKTIKTDSSSNIIPEKVVENNDGSIECWQKPYLEVINTTIVPDTLTDLDLLSSKGVPTLDKILIRHSNTGSSSELIIKSKYTETEFGVCYVETSTSGEAEEYRDCIIDIMTGSNSDIEYRRTGGTTQSIVVRLLSYLDYRKD